MKPDLSPVEPAHDYIRPLQSVDTSMGAVSEGNSRPVSQPLHFSGRGSARTFSSGNSPGSAVAAENYQQLMQVPDTTSETYSWWLVEGKSLLINQEGSFLSLPMSELHAHMLTHQFEQQVPVSQPLLMPVSIEATESLLQHAHGLYEPLLACAVEIGWSGKRILVRKVPAGFRQHNWSAVLSGLLENSLDPEKVMPRLLSLLAANIDDFTQQQALHDWSWLISTYPNDWQEKLQQWCRPVPLAKWLGSQDG